MKYHEVEKLVNDLRDMAVSFHDHQSLRDRISRLLVPKIDELRALDAKIIASSRLYLAQYECWEKDNYALHDEISALRSQLAAVTKERDEFKRDAERYRWLRRKSNPQEG